MMLSPPSQSEMWFDYVKYGRVKYCHHPYKSGCNGKIISAHSVQKERILSQIEGTINNNRVLYSLNDHITKNHRIVGLTPIGKSKASIFSGFCDYHDKMFSAIENYDFTASPEQSFLFAYRGFTHGLHQLLEQLTWYNSQSPIVKLFPFNYVSHFKQYYQQQLAKFSNVKAHLDKCLMAKNFGALNHHIRVFDLLPLTCSSVLSPIYTYKNIYLNPAQLGSYLVLNIIPDQTQTHVMISHIIGDRLGEVFFNELKALSDAEFTEAVSSLLLYCTSNTFFSPGLWDKFTPQQKQQLYDELNFATFEGEKIKAFHVSKVDFFKINASTST
jgi:hypothetical protein